MTSSELYDPEFSPKRDTGRRHSSRSRSPVGRDRPPVDDRDAKKIFVSNLPWNMSWEKVKELFRNEAGVECFVDLLMNEKGKSKGVAYCLFRTSDAAQQAIDKMNRYEIDGRKIIVRRESLRDRRRLAEEKMEEHRRQELLRNDSLLANRGMGNMGMSSGLPGGYGLDSQAMGRPMANVQPMGGSVGVGGTPNLNSIVASGGLQSLLRSLGIEGPISNRVFVSNLDFKVTKDKVKEIFDMGGKVTNVEMKMDRDDKFKGFCVVEFSTELEAVQAISMFNRQQLYDRTMGVRMDRFEPRGDTGGRRLPEGLRGIGSGLGIGGQAARGLDLQNLNMPSSLPMDVGGGMGASGMGGMPSDLGGMGGNLSDLGMLGGGLRSGLGNGISGGMDSLRDLAGVGRDLGGVGVGSTFDRMSNVLDRRLGAGGGGGPSDRGQSFYVIVKNLPFSYTWKTLKEKLMIAGNVQHTDIKTDESGRSRGIGVARFASLEDARRAVALLDGTMTEGRRISVHLE